jgi:hypothetical protein
MQAATVASDRKREMVRQSDMDFLVSEDGEDRGEFASRMAGSLSSDFDEHFAVLYDRRVGLDRDYARRGHHLAGLDVELAVMKITFNHIAIDIALG